MVLLKVLVLLFITISCYSKDVIKQARVIQLGIEYTFYSDIINEQRVLLVHTPEGYATSKQNYPVLYLLDAEYDFLFTAGIIDYLEKSSSIPKMIIVGISNIDRNRDYTPTPGDSERRRFPTSGGSEKFTRFLRDEVFIIIDKNYRTAPFRILRGHSLGGLFTLQTLINYSDLFDVYIASSPSLYWNNQSTLRQLQKTLDDINLAHKRLYFSMGNERKAMVDSSEALALFLRTIFKKDFSYEYLYDKEDNHASTSFNTTKQVLPKVFEINLETAKTFDKFENYEAYLFKTFGFDLRIPYMQLWDLSRYYKEKAQISNIIATAKHEVRHYRNKIYEEKFDWYEKAQQLLASGDILNSISLLKILISLDAKMLDARITLAEAQIEIKDFEGALESYQKIKQFNPKEKNLQQKILNLTRLLKVK